MYPVEGSANVAHFEALQRDGFPFVLADRYFPALACDVVVPNNVVIGYQLTDYLIRSGHRHIALLWLETACTSVHDRLTGYHMALRDHGIPAEPALTAMRSYGAPPEQERRAQLKAWLEAPYRPTAYLGSNAEVLAIVAHDFLAGGVSIPGEIVLASMDTAAVDPILTVVTASAVLPSYEMGQEAVRLLRERLEGKADRPPRHIVLQAAIHTGEVRDLVDGAPPQAAGNRDPVA